MKFYKSFEELNPEWYSWHPVPYFNLHYEDPRNIQRLVPQGPAHYHPEPPHFDDRCGACVDQRSRGRQR